VLPPFEDLGDGSTRGDELGGGHQHCHEHEENDAEGDDSGSSDVEDDRDLNADVVPTVGEGDAGDGRHGNALT
jgi:hypothetical protein